MGQPDRPADRHFLRGAVPSLEARRKPHPIDQVEAATDRVFVVLKGQRRGEPLSDEGLNQVFVSARERAGLRRITCHELRHTCFTRLREAGMELEALQAQAGHRSIETTRLYVHLATTMVHDAHTINKGCQDYYYFMASR